MRVLKGKILNKINGGEDYHDSIKAQIVLIDKNIAAVTQAQSHKEKEIKHVTTTATPKITYALNNHIAKTAANQQQQNNAISNTDNSASNKKKKGKGNCSIM